jgi:GTPase SAR1 family protein
MACRAAVLGTRRSGKSTLVNNLDILSETEEWVELPQYSPAIEQSFTIVLVLYDLTQPEIFYQALDTVMKVKHLPRLLIGNKADLATYKH